MQALKGGLTSNKPIQGRYILAKMARKNKAVEEAVKEKLAQMKAGKLDANLGLVGWEGREDEAAIKKRLSAFCLRAGKEALVVLGDWHQGVSLEAALTVTEENWAKDRVMSKRALEGAKYCLWGLLWENENVAEGGLRQLGVKDLEEMGLALGVLVADFTMALEEEARVSQSHASPTLL